MEILRNKAQFLKNKRIKLIGILVIFGIGSKIFVHQFLNLSLQEEYILVWAIIGLFLVNEIKHRLRYIPMILLSILIMILLIIWIIPLYQNEVDISGFEKNTPIKIISQTQEQENIFKANPTITIQQWDKKQTIWFLENTSLQLKNSADFQILFQSKIKLEKSYIYAQLPNWLIIQVKSQSAIQIKHQNNITEIKNIAGTSKYSYPEWYKPKIQTDKNSIYIQIQDFEGKQLLNTYIEDRNQAIIDQQGWMIVTIPIMDMIIKTVINTLYSIQPEIYGKNILNYNTFRNIIPKQSRFSSFNIANDQQKNIQNDMIWELKKWIDQSNILQQMNK